MAKQAKKTPAKIKKDPTKKYKLISYSGGDIFRMGINGPINVECHVGKSVDLTQNQFDHAKEMGAEFK